MDAATSARPLRVAVWYNLPSGGAKRALYEHLVGLQELGHTVEAWRPPVHESDYLPLDRIMPEHVTPYVEAKPRFSEKWLGAGQRRREAMIEHSREAAREIEAGGFDVLFANTCTRYASPYIGRYASLPKALYLQEPKRAVYEPTPRLPWIALPREVRESNRPEDVKRRLRHAWEAKQVGIQAAEELDNAAAFDRILCNSTFSREAILRAYGLDATVCYLGIDTGLFHPMGLAREPFVMSVGAFHPAKDPEFIVRSLGTIATNRPKLLWVANLVNPGYYDSVSALAKKLGVELEVRKSVPDEELLELYNRAAAAIYAPRLEPFGYMPIEANACGCPVVAVSEGGVKETVVDGENGIVVPHRPEAMGAAIAALLADPERGRKLGERGTVLAKERWSRRTAALELERNLREVIAEKTGQTTVS